MSDSPLNPETVYVGRDVIEFVDDIHAQYGDKISMIEAQRDSAQGDAIRLNIELGKVRRQMVSLERRLESSQREVDDLQERVFVFEAQAEDEEGCETDEPDTYTKADDEAEDDQRQEFTPGSRRGTDFDSHS